MSTNDEQPHPCEHDPSCEKVNRFLAEFVDGALSRDTAEEFRRHLKKCPSCETFLEQYRRTIDLLRAERDIAVPDRLVEHTLEFMKERIGSGRRPDSDAS